MNRPQCTWCQYQCHNFYQNIKSYWEAILGFHVTSSKNYTLHIDHLKLGLQYVLYIHNRKCSWVFELFPLFGLRVIRDYNPVTQYCHAYSKDVKQSNLQQITHIWVGLWIKLLFIRHLYKERRFNFHFYVVLTIRILSAIHFLLKKEFMK